MVSTGTLQKVQPTERRFSPGVEKGPVWSQTLRHCIWCILTIAFVLAFVEGAFALAGVGESQYIQLAPLVGTLHIPGKTVTWREEGYSHFSINAAGFHDKERTVAKPSNVKRIAFLGDSMTEAFQVPMDRSYTALFENALNSDKKLANKFEVMNCAVAGYSTVQDLYLLKNRVLAYKPDICVLAYHAGDIDKNVLMDYVKFDFPRPYCGLDTAGKLQTDWSMYDGSAKSANAEFFKNTEYLRLNSRIWDVLTHAELQLMQLKPYLSARTQLFKAIGNVTAKRSQTGPASKDNATAATAAGRKSDTTTDIFGQTSPPNDLFAPFAAFLPNPPQPTTAPLPVGLHPKIAKDIAAIRYSVESWRGIMEANRRRFAITARIIEEMNGICRANNCKFVVVALPAANNSFLYFRQLQYMQALAKAHNFAFIDENRFFPSFDPDKATDNFYHIHFAKPGHERMAASLQSEFERLGLLNN